MSVILLDKTRKINKLLQKFSTQRLVFNDICEVMSDVLESNIVILSQRGKILGAGIKKDIPLIQEYFDYEIGNFLNEQFHERVLGILSTKENVNFETLGFSNKFGIDQYAGMIIPIDIATERLGSLILYKNKGVYTIEDIILGEYGSAVIGLEIMRSIKEENTEEMRKSNLVKSAIATLSFSEQEAIKKIFDELEGNEGILVASKVADKAGITRSVIVNALRKFESAGVIESRSLGMKGTYIKVVNELLVNEIRKL